ncbi:MAG: SusC/RagA family TonB-linked outer membrane protein [Longimonas sp.]|uniref:SusC/RagA family TonB-linked outer membrane protein n=1 Tax=Longimonas sp. TaxID=2039626 RepID=UPI0033477B3B
MSRRVTSLISALALLIFLPGLVSAQEGNISGTVIDGTTEDPLPGATVQIVGTSIGAATNADGEYELVGIPAGEQTVRFSFVGYDALEEQVEVLPGETITVDAALIPGSAELDQIVVTGVSVGTDTRKLGFTVSKVGGDQLQEVPGTDPANALRAKTPGARIVQASGQPGTAPSVRLRGTTTLSGSQEPLVVIDGAITSGGLEDIDMQSVESIEIVKGAAAASLYGSLAGNGVIQIITKRGADDAGTTRVTVRNEFGFTQLANKIDLSDHHNRGQLDEDGNVVSRDFREQCNPDASNPFFRDDGSPCNINPELPSGVFQNPFDRNFDQQDVLYDSQAFFTNYVSVASRQDNLNYLLSFENSQNDGVVTGVDPYKRRNLRLNVDNQVSDRVDVAVSLLYSNSDGTDALEQGQGANNLFYGALLSFPDLDLRAPAPEGVDAPFNPFSTAGNAANPLYRAAVIDRDFGGERLFGNFSVNYDATDWLTLDGQFSWDDDTDTFSTLTPQGTFPTDPASPRSQGALFSFESNERLLTTTFRALLSYDFGDLSTQLVGRYVYEDREIQSQSVSGSDFLARDVPRFGNTDRDNLNVGNEFQATIRSEDIVGNLVLDYRDRYIVDAVLRQERVSLFGPDARDKTYWRVAGTWRATQDFTIPNIQELKFRGALGTSGSRPPFVAQYETFSVSPSGITKNVLGNRNIQPADVFEFEVGVDASFLDRFFFEGTYAAADAADQVLLVPLSASAGFNSQYQNAATIETSTWEFAAGGQLIDQGDWGLDFGVVFDRTRQQVTSLNRPSFNLNVGGALNIFRIEEGVDLGVMYGNQLASSVDDLLFDENNCLVGEGGCLNPGDLTINDDGYVIEAGTEYTLDENPFYIRDENGAAITTKIGDSNPDFNMGLNTTLRYKNWRLFTTVDIEQGADVYNYTRQLLYFNDRHGDLDQTDRPEGERRPASYYQGPLYNQASASSHFVEDASFVKLREVSLSYRFTNDFVNRIGLGGAIHDARVSILGRNLLTFTDYGGFDPEVSTSSASQPVNYKFDEFGYPNFRTFSASIEIRL